MKHRAGFFFCLPKTRGPTRLRIVEYLDCFSANFFDDMLEYGLFNDPIHSELTFSLLLVKLGLTKSKTPQIHLFFSILSRFQSLQGRSW